MKNLRYILFGSISIGVLLLFSFGYNTDNPIQVNSNNEYEKSLVIFDEQVDRKDIYLIILDEYAGKETLQKEFDYNNEKFYSELRERGFFLPEINHSNYPYTKLSIPSILNMHYIDFLSNEREDVSKYDSAIKGSLQKNLVMQNLKNNGYEIFTFFTGGGATGADSLVTKKFCGEFFYAEHINISIKKIVPFFENQYDPNFKRDRIECALSTIPKINENDNPIFVYAHILLPHEPYVFDSNGNYVQIKEILDVDTEKKLYLEQLEYVNKKIVEVIDKIQKNSQNQPIIIILSDHGQRIGIDWQNPSQDMIIQSFNNLNAYYFPEKKIFHESISPVNTFRLLFNEYFNTHFEILEDKNYWLQTDEYPYDFTDVTHFVKTMND